MNFTDTLRPHLRKSGLVAAGFVLSLPLVGNAEPEVLTEADRIAVIEQLEAIQKRSDERVSGLYRRALSDYRIAIQSDTATMELYLKCIEKVQFIEQYKKPIEFREWKRRNKDKHNSVSFRMALRHQLSWLLLSIEAAQKDGDLSEMGARAISHLDQIFNNAANLQEHRQVLSQNALNSVFARAYSLNIKVEGWPDSALDIANIYDKVVLPSLRKPTRIGALRNAWTQRVRHEGQVFEKWNDDEVDTTRIGTKESLRSPDFDKFLAERRPTLQWMKEVDCYEVGDQKGSVVKMLSHIEKNITHKDAPEWISKLQELVDGEGGEGEIIAGEVEKAVTE